MTFVNDDNLYFDAETNDARLCNEVINDATHRSHATAINYCEVQAIDTRQKTSMVRCFDHIENWLIGLGI